LYGAPRGEPRISIVIVSYCRADEIERCLADLAAQHTTVTFEVLLLLQAYPRVGAGMTPEPAEARIVA